MGENYSVLKIIKNQFRKYLRKLSACELEISGK